MEQLTNKRPTEPSILFRWRQLFNSVMANIMHTSWPILLENVSINLIGKGHSSHYILLWYVCACRWPITTHTHTQTRLHAAAHQWVVGHMLSYRFPSFPSTKPRPVTFLPSQKWTGEASTSIFSMNKFSSCNLEARKSLQVSEIRRDPKSGWHAEIRRKSTIRGHRGKVIKTNSRSN